MKTFATFCLVFCIYTLTGISDAQTINSAENNIIGTSSSSGCKDMLGTTDSQDREEDCSERLVWTYDAESNTLKMVNENVYLHCCIEYSAMIWQMANGITYFYQMDSSDSPCDCMCYYDFTAQIFAIPQQTMTLVIKRYHFDNPTWTLIWKGDIDLSQGSGIILIKKVEECK